MQLALQGFADGSLPVGRDEEQEEAAAAGAGQFSAAGPGRPGSLIELIDFRVRDLGTKAALGLPRLVKQVAKSADVHAAGQDVDAFVDQFLHDAELAGAGFDFGHVTAGDVRRGPRDPRVEKHQMSF